MTDPVSLSISALALATSVANAWLTLLRLGTVRMTQPTVIFFGPDGRPDEGDTVPKVFLRTLLYSTSQRGRIVQAMYVRLRRGETAQIFNVWAYGDERLVRGSGLFVGKEGVACNHHFLLPSDGTRYVFLPGRYRIEVFVSLVGTKRDLLLSATELQLGESEARALEARGNGLYFDWGPDSTSYQSHVRSSPPRDLPPGLLALLGPLGSEEKEDKEKSSS